MSLILRPFSFKFVSVNLVIALGKSSSSLLLVMPVVEMKHVGRGDELESESEHKLFFFHSCV